jgi:uncharacterized membrane protein (UPF0127 family)
MKVYFNEEIIVNKIKIADTFKKRLIGLIGRDKLQDEGLLLTNCSSIHCFFMKTTIDVVYLSNNMTVLYKETIKPWRIGKFIKGTKHILEIPENASECIKIGDTIELI